MTASWDMLRRVLRRLAQQDPMPLTSWPEPDSEQQPPFVIGLAAWAIPVAEELHQRFGDDVTLTVGALRYPHRTLHRRQPLPSPAAVPELNPAQLRVELDGPLSIRSGHQARHGLLISNLTSVSCRVETPGVLVAEIVDPATRAVIGGYSGALWLVRKIFTVGPGRTSQVPLLVGTDSFVPDLGYAIPPGSWGIQAFLHPALDQAVRTPVFPLSITS